MMDSKGIGHSPQICSKLVHFCSLFYRHNQCTYCICLALLMLRLWRQHWQVTTNCHFSSYTIIIIAIAIVVIIIIDIVIVTIIIIIYGSQHCLCSDYGKAIGKPSSTTHTDYHLSLSLIIITSIIIRISWYQHHHYEHHEITV